MRAWLRKWGNSAAVRLPVATLAAAGLRVDQEVEVRVQDGRVVIEPLVDDGYLGAVEGALGEWDSAEDEEGFAALRISRGSTGRLCGPEEPGASAETPQARPAGGRADDWRRSR